MTDLITQEGNHFSQGVCFFSCRKAHQFLWRNSQPGILTLLVFMHATNGFTIANQPCAGAGGYFRLCLLHLWCIYTHVWWSLFLLPEQLQRGPTSYCWRQGRISDGRKDMGSHPTLPPQHPLSLQRKRFLMEIYKAQLPHRSVSSQGVSGTHTHTWTRHQQDLKRKGSSQMHSGVWCLSPTAHTPCWLPASMSQRLLFLLLGLSRGPSQLLYQETILGTSLIWPYSGGPMQPGCKLWV